MIIFEIRRISPSVAFFFACLDAFLGSSSDHCPWVGDFVLGDSILGLMLGDLCPLLCQFLDWFRSVREALRRENMGSKVRSSDLETSLSSSAGMARAETDTTTSMPSCTLVFSPFHSYSTPSISCPQRRVLLEGRYL